MTKSEEIRLRTQLMYLKGKVEVYESLLYSNDILKRPEIISLDETGGK